MKKQDKNIKNNSSAAENNQSTEIISSVKVDASDVLLDLVGKVQVLSENYETLRTALTLVFPHLVGKVKVLSENYQTLSKAYVDLKAVCDRYEGILRLKEEPAIG